MMLTHNFAELKHRAKQKERTHDTNGEKFIGLLQRAIKTGFGRNMIILGEPGSGKSWACMRLAERLDLNGFTPDKVAFTAKEFMECIMRSKPGDAIVYEEVGVNISNRQWWKQFGQNAIMQTIRHKNLFVIMNCPNMDFVDKPITKLIHYTFKMMEMNQRKGYSIMRPIRTETDGQFNYTKKLYPMIEGVLITQIKVGSPSVKIRHQYEKKSKIFKNDLNKKFLDEELEKEKGD